MGLNEDFVGSYREDYEKLRISSTRKESKHVGLINTRQSL